MKTRFESLPKKDRDEVLRIKRLMDERAPDARNQVLESLMVLQRHPATPSQISPMSLLASTLHHLTSEFCDRGIIQRLLADDPAQEVIGLRTSARLGYLMTVAGGPEYSGGYDCAHIFDMLAAIASEDRFAISRFVDRFPPPFKTGHPSTVLLANAIYSVLADDHAGFQGLAEKLRTRKESRFFRAMYDCLLAIMARDADHVCRAIDEMARWNRRQEQLNSAMQKLLCIPAHASYNICLVRFSRSGQALPPLPTVDTLDAGLHSFIHESKHDSTQMCFDFSGINPILFRWVQELPFAVRVDELIGESDKSFTMPNNPQPQSESVSRRLVVPGLGR